MIRAINIVAHEPELLPKVRELYSRMPESRFREAWELQHLLYSIGCCDGLVPESEIALPLRSPAPTGCPTRVRHEH
jgi:hypothetical protein